VQKEKPNYYAILEADVRYDKSLSSTAKIIYAEITALTNKSGYCWATNKYFAELFDISESQVSRIISKLVGCDYIDLEIKDDYKRKLTLRKKRKGGTQKAQTPPTQKCVHNNTSINNKTNNTFSDVELLKTINQVIGRDFRTLPRGYKKTLELFSLEEIKAALTNLSNDEWHSPRLKTLKLDYLIRATTIDKFRLSESVQEKVTRYGKRFNLETMEYERYEI
jgi:hypothetical protein